MFFAALIDAWAPILTANEWLVASVLHRKIHGWKKRADHISLSQIEAACGMASSSVARAVKSLIARGLIRRKGCVDQAGDSAPSLTSFAPKSLWPVLLKRTENQPKTPQKSGGGGPSIGPQVVPLLDTQPFTPTTNDSDGVGSVSAPVTPGPSLSIADVGEGNAPEDVQSSFADAKPPVRTRPRSPELRMRESFTAWRTHARRDIRREPGQKEYREMSRLGTPEQFHEFLVDFMCSASEIIHDPAYIVHSFRRFVEGSYVIAVPSSGSGSPPDLDNLPF